MASNCGEQVSMLLHQNHFMSKEPLASIHQALLFLSIINTQTSEVVNEVTVAIKCGFFIAPIPKFINRFSANHQPLVLEIHVKGPIHLSWA